MPATKKFNGKTFTLYKEGMTHSSHGVTDTDLREIKNELKGKYLIRVEKTIWGNTRIWVRAT